MRCYKCDRYCFYVLALDKFKCCCGAIWDVERGKRGVFDYG